MANLPFDEIESAVLEGDTSEALRLLETSFREQGKFHELFEVRKMQLRHRLRLPLFAQSALEGEDAEGALAQQLETGLLQACREIGNLLLDEGQIREAWMYLRAVGDRVGLARKLESLDPQEDNIDEIIELALHEGIAPGLGLRLMLSHYGTCNSVTALTGQFPSLSDDARQVTAAILLRHIHDELRASILAHCLKRDANVDKKATISGLLQGDPALMEDGHYHIDVSHLSAGLRFAQVLDDPEELRVALELARYGSRLNPDVCLPGEEPFVDLFGSHELFFAALLDENRQTALDYFRGRAAEVDAHQSGTLAAEVYVDLLSRCGQLKEAIAQAVKSIPPGTHTTGTAPSLLELSQKASNYDEFLRLAREGEDLLSFVAGLIGQQKDSSQGT